MREELEEIVRKKRAYASYFDFRGDRSGTETGVVMDWLFARYQKPEKYFAAREHRPNPFDPPDVVLVDHQGGRHGIEVTELVDGLTVSARVKNRSIDFKEYKEEEFLELVSKRIIEKTGEPFKDASCLSKKLLIYSDEPSLSYGDCIAFFSRFPTVSQSFFDEIWFVIPPALNSSGGEPENPHCRIFEIKSG